MRNPMITQTGIYTHAVYGFINMLQRVMREHNPSYLAIAFDRKSPTFRHIEYDAYKAGRKAMPDELGMQFPLLKEVLCAMNITCLEMDGFEADDLIGTICKEAEQKGLSPLVITGDRDELQLISERTSVLITKKGVSEFELYTPESFAAKYGFGHELFVDFKGLMGDQSDNIPGLPGVGDKTATKLITEYGSVENIIAHVDEVKPDRIRGIIEDNAQTALMSKRLATIVTDAPIELDIQDMAVREPDLDRLREVYTKLEFRSFLKKLDGGVEKHSGAGITVETVEKVKLEDMGLRTIEISNEAGVKLLSGELDACDEIVFNIVGSKDHVNSPEIDIIYVGTKEHVFFSVVTDKPKLKESITALLVEKNKKLLGCALQHDIYTLKILAKNVGKNYSPQIGFDASIADYLLEAGRSSEDIRSLVLTYAEADFPEEPKVLPSQTMLPGLEAFGADDASEEYAQNVADYGKKFCEAILTLRPYLEKRLVEDEQASLFADIELPLSVALADVETQGFKFDEKSLREIAKNINDRIDELTAEIYDLAGEEFNINSPKQLGVILFEKLGLKGGKKNRNGFSTSADILEKLRFEHPIIAHVLEYRTLMKLKSTYIDGLPKFVAADGKIRAHFMQAVTATGRLSCADPNLQNIPIRQEPGRFIRKAFVAESEEFVLMGADYSQIELRVLAHLSGDPQLISDFCTGADIHRRTAARVFGVENEADVTPEQRGAAKAVNFGIVYGMSSFGLSEELSIGVKDAKRYINDYFSKHAQVKEYLDRCIEEVKARGYSETLLGRRRRIPEISAEQHNVRLYGERLAMNSPVQGSAADIIKIAMNKVYARLGAEGLRSKLILQVHDELILQVPKGEEELAAKVLKDEMERALTLKVPLIVEIKTGQSWYELK
jgi:DNA polymerase-1